MKIHLKGLALLLLFAFAFSCSKSDEGSSTPEPEPEPEPVTDVYAVGSEIVNIVNNYAKATIWKNGVATYLNEGMDYYGRATDVFVSGTDVYVVGVEVKLGGTYYDPILWKNGVKTVLPHKNEIIPKAVFVHNGHTFVVGHEREEIEPNSRYGTPILWRNGEKMILENDAAFAYTVNDVFVVNNDIYVVGAEHKRNSITNYAVLWKNGIRTVLTDRVRSSAASSVSVSGNDVYITGWERGGKDVLWKNGVARPLLSPGSDTSLNGKTSLYVSGNDVYVAGNSSDLIGSYGWVSKNNAAPVTLSPTADESWASSIFVLGTDVYVGGGIGKTDTSTIATYWKNGEENRLTDGTTGSRVSAIFVTKN